MKSEKLRVLGFLFLRVSSDQSEINRNVIHGRRLV